MFHKSGAHIRTDAHSRGLICITFGVSSKGALAPGPLMESPRTEMPRSYTPPSFFIQNPQYTNTPPPDSRFSSDVKELPWRKKPVSGAFLNVSSRVPSKGALSGGPPHSASSETDPLFLESLHLSLTLVYEPTS